jgi:pullulanase
MRSATPTASTGATTRIHFNAPEGSFASSPGDGARRIVELRAMVQALHAAGLRVGMDVVYNHTTASGQNDKAVLDRVVPGYYHRLNAVGEVETLDLLRQHGHPRT